MNTRIFLSLVYLVTSSVGHADVSLSEDVTVEFASKELTGSLLAQPDDYNARLSAFDRIAKTQSTAPVTDDEFRAYQGKQGLAWSRRRAAKIYRDIRVHP